MGNCIGENHLTEGYEVTEKTMDLLKQHLQQTSGKVEWNITIIKNN